MSSLLKKNDMVKVISGKAVGKTGRILRVFRDKNRVTVEGVNFAKKHQKPSQKDQKGGIVDKELTVHASNLMFLNKANEPVKIVRGEVEGRRVRMEKKTGKAVD